MKLAYIFSLCIALLHPKIFVQAKDTSMFYHTSKKTYCYMVDTKFKKTSSKKSHSIKTFSTITKCLNAITNRHAQRGDKAIVFIQPGQYPETLTIDCTLCSIHFIILGRVTIGRDSTQQTGHPALIWNIAQEKAEHFIPNITFSICDTSWILDLNKKLPTTKVQKSYTKFPYTPLTFLGSIEIINAAKRKACIHIQGSDIQGDVECSQGHISLFLKDSRLRYGIRGEPHFKLHYAANCYFDAHATLHSIKNSETSTFKKGYTLKHKELVLPINIPQPKKQTVSNVTAIVRLLTSSHNAYLKEQLLIEKQE